MDTRYIETLIAVARRGSLAAAAQQQGLTATAVTQRLQALEREFGTPLVTRSGRTVRPTEAGFAVLARADRFLAELDALRASAAGQEIAGELRIGAISTALTGLLPAVLDLLARQHPDLNVYLEPGASNELYDRTLGGSLDGAVLVRPAFNWPKDIDFRPWRRERFELLVPADEKRECATEILRDRPLIMYDRRQWGARQAAAWLEAHGLMRDPRLELDALEAIAVLVARGLGVSVVPDWAGPRPAGLELRRIALPEPFPSREIGLIFPRNGVRAHLLRVLMAATRKPAI